MDKKHKKKNKLDLEYSTLLNTRAIWIVLIGTFAISVAFSDVGSKMTWLFLAFAFLVIIYGLYNRLLEDKKEEIDRI
ncbi:hypothetical protein ACFL1B_04540 [Nanoarchaeota archaeon]